MLERDFWVAGQMASRQRGSLDPGFVEISIGEVPSTSLRGKSRSSQRSKWLPLFERDSWTLPWYVYPEEDDNTEESSEDGDRGGDESSKTAHPSTLISPNDKGALGSGGDGSGASRSAGSGSAHV